MKKIFEAHIQKLILKEDNFIYKTNLELLRLFYNFLYTKFNDEILCKLYLEQFTSISDITSSKIESNFYDVINDSNIKLFDIDDSELLNESGVYCIFNEIGNLMYVGKTNNLSSRPYQSFINKLPYGATYIKLLKYIFPLNDCIESVMIDYYLPIYNNKKEQLPSWINNRQYCNLMQIVKKDLEQSKSIYPL
jgi:hypothetical protein